MTDLNRVHLNGLRAVECVARCGSLAAAAVELGVSPGAVSQHLIRTEAILGTSLFQRTPAGLVPLANASAFFLELKLAFGALSDAVAKLDAKGKRRLTVSVAPVFASKWLVPRLGAFQALHPEIQILVDATVALVDFKQSDVDVAIRIGKGPYPGVRTEKLIDQEIFPVCSPALVERLKTPADLQAVPIVRDANSNLSWGLWLEAFGLPAEILPEGPAYSDSALCLDAAIGGQGVLLAWPTLAADALKEGRLLRPFAHAVQTGQAYWLVSPLWRKPDQKVQIFAQWLKSELATSLQGQA
jgi:LysR family transcriptional regulator, glycine cleavage system transcriptional activator